MKRSFFSPVFFKEMVQAATSRRVFVLKVVIMSLLFISTLLPIFVNDHLNDLPSIGIFMTKVLLMVQLITVLLAVPLMTAGTISNERRHNTMALLFLTGLKNWL